ncbi:hypothetical protein DBR06_SOUSAS3810033, partial [Sousa chinensis]
WTWPFYNHKKSYDMKMDQVCSTNTGVISCMVC